jgi:hypothetical protein
VKWRFFAKLPGSALFEEKSVKQINCKSGKDQAECGHLHPIPFFSQLTAAPTATKVPHTPIWIDGATNPDCCKPQKECEYYSDLGNVQHVLRDQTLFGESGDVSEMAIFHPLPMTA